MYVIEIPWPRAQEPQTGLAGQGARAGPGPRVPGLGPGRAGLGRRPLGILYLSWISWIYLGFFFADFNLSEGCFPICLRIFYKCIQILYIF